MGLAGHGCALHHEESVHVGVLTEPAKCVQMVLGMKVEAPQKPATGHEPLELQSFSASPDLCCIDAIWDAEISDT